MAEDKKKIVFIDDDPNWAYILPELGQILGYNIKSFHSVDNYYESIEVEDNVDLLITDIRMPGKSGYEIIKEYKKKNPKSSVMIITAYDTHKLQKFVDKYRIDSYLLKPFSINEFEQSVESFFG
ncbi:MAG: response regulator [Candidatus Zixiibacteriota bacterium]